MSLSPIFAMASAKSSRCQINSRNSNFSDILAGGYNSTSTCACVMIVGNNITADRNCTTFVNNLSIKNIPTSSAGLPSGSIYRIGNAVCIVY